MADDTEREALARLICTVRSVRMMEDDQGREYRALVLEVDGSASGFTAADVWRATPMVLMRANDFATPGLEVAIYELSSVACAKVGKAKVRPAQMRRHGRSL